MSFKSQELTLKNLRDQTMADKLKKYTMLSLLYN